MNKILAILAIILMVGSLSALTGWTVSFSHYSTPPMKINETVCLSFHISEVNGMVKRNVSYEVECPINIVCDPIGCFDHSTPGFRTLIKWGKLIQYEPVSGAIRFVEPPTPPIGGGDAEGVDFPEVGAIESGSQWQPDGVVEIAGCYECVGGGGGVWG